tara:strand:- start:3184 stop:3993 length:810 start_codon:yes stop_codon:yes gene_type:complete
MSDKNSSDILIVEKKEEGILYLTMNNPQNRNALSESLMNMLTIAINQASIDQDTKVIIISAHGPVFCAGHDLKEMSAARDSNDDGRHYFIKLFDICSVLMKAIVNCHKPVIAEINGTATAAGCQLVASCDLAIASNSSKFATPGVNLGLFCSTPMVALSRNVKNKNAMEMLLTGDFIDAVKAKEIGLINRSVSDEQVQNETLNLAKKISSKSSMTVAIGKEAFYKQLELDLSAAYNYTSQVMADNMLQEDAKEGINAFIEKRAPEWKNK